MSLKNLVFVVTAVGLEMREVMKTMKMNRLQ
jgi:hypothetical protein